MSYPDKSKDGFRYYGQWAGDPEGQREDVNCCIATVWSQDRSCHSYQCQRKRGHGKGKLFCKQHAKMYN